MLRVVVVHGQRRSFVSSVLLSRTWENESVGDLRRELKTRGLPVKGNKATLVLRIQQHESAQTRDALRGPTHGPAPTIQPFMNISLPDLSHPVPEPPVQIPYVPDFWDSSSPQPPLPEEPLPKLNVVAALDTHFTSHNLLDENTTVLASPQTPVPPKPTTDDGILADITDDLGLPRPHQIKSAFSSLFS